MSAKRIDMYRLQELVRLHRIGHSGRQIARMLGMGRNTVAGYLSALEAGGVLEGDADDLPAEEVLKSCLDEHLPATLAPQQESTVEIHRPEIEQMLEKGAGPQADLRSAASRAGRLRWQPLGRQASLSADQEGVGSASQRRGNPRRDDGRRGRPGGLRIRRQAVRSQGRPPAACVGLRDEPGRASARGSLLLVLLVGLDRVAVHIHNRAA